MGINMNIPEIIISIISSIIALISVILLIWYETQRRKDKFEDLVFDCLKGTTIILNDIYQILSLDYAPDTSRIEEADALITEGFTRLYLYASAHHLKFLEKFSKIAVKDEDKKTCYSRYLTKLSENYLRYRKTIINKDIPIGSEEREFIEHYCSLFRKFMKLGTKYSRNLLINDRYKKSKEAEFVEILRKIVEEAKGYKLPIYENE